jgi:dTMP kinase
VRELHDFACSGFLPDRTLVLTHSAGHERAMARDGESADRIGGRGEDFHHKVELAFRILAAEEPERVKLVDADGSEADVTERLMSAISDLLP